MIDGPRISPANGGRAKSLVVLLHGYGADGHDLIDIGRHLSPVLPDTAFVSPHAPDVCGGAPNGRQWFPLSVIDPHRLHAQVSEAAPVLDSFIDAELEQHDLTDRDLALVGFSQGTMMALHVALRRTAMPAGVVGFSGLLAGPEHLPGEMRNTPPVLLVHGEADTVVPAMATMAAARALGREGVSVEWHLRPGLRHGIDATGLELASTFLSRVLAPGSAAVSVDDDAIAQQSPSAD
jgi:phospholipase/carboxylesterase